MARARHHRQHRPETGPSRGLEDVLRRLLGHLGRGRLELKLLGTAQLPAERAAVLLSLNPEGRCNYATMYRVYCITLDGCIILYSGVEPPAPQS